ncbi:MAG: hypothetical protein H0X26_08400 [Alphaproteobacteria bacterium]|nr:hypothetical protein [Alphaproteobacteria bacterium]
MFKKIVSYAIIFSFLYPDIAFCMLDPEAESPPEATKKVTVSHNNFKDPSLFNLIPEDHNGYCSLADKEPLHSEIESKNTQKFTLSSDCTMSEESQQDHSLSPPSNESSPRADQTLKDISPRSDEVSPYSPSQARGDWTHLSLVLSSESTESGFTHSSEEDNKNTPPKIISPCKGLSPFLHKEENNLLQGAGNTITIIETYAKSTTGTPEDSPFPNLLIDSGLHLSLIDAQNSTLSRDTLPSLLNEASESDPSKEKEGVVAIALDYVKAVLTSEKEISINEDGKIIENDEQTKEKKESSSQFPVGMTLSANSLTPLISDLVEEKGPSLNNSIINLIQDEALQQKIAAEITLPLPINPTVSPNQQSDQQTTVSDQLPISSDLPLEKVKEVTGSKEAVKETQETIISEKTVIKLTSPETNLVKSLSLTPPISTVPLASSSPQDSGQSSNSRRNSTEDSSGDTDFIHKTEVQIDSLKSAIPLQLMAPKEKEQKKKEENESTSPLPEDKGLMDSNSSKPLSLEVLKSPKIYHEDQGEKQKSSSSPSEKIKVPFNFIGTWKNAKKEEKEIYLRPNSERKRNTQDNIDFKETTGLLSKEKQPFYEGNSQGKPSELRNSLDFLGLGSEKEIKLSQLSNKKNGANEQENTISEVNSESESKQFTNTKKPQAISAKSKNPLIQGIVLPDEEADDELSFESKNLQKDDQNFEEEAGLLPPQPKKKNHQIDLLINEDSEDLLESPLFPLDSEVLNTLVHKFNNLSPEDKKQLQHIKIQDIVRENSYLKKPWYEYAAMFVGAVTGGFKAAAMPILYTGGIIYVNMTYSVDILWHKSDGIVFGAYIILSTIFDAFPSNISLWKKAATYVFEESIEKTRMLLTGIVSFCAGLLEPLNLASTELYIMSLLGLTGTDNEYVRAIKTYCFPLLLDSGASIYDLTWQYTDNVLDWFESQAAPQLFSFQRSPEAILRDSFRNTLDKLSEYVFKVAEDHGYLTDLYDTLFSFETTIKKELKDVVEDDNMDAAHTFFLLRHLLSLGDKIQEAQQQIKTWNELLKDWGIWAVIWGTLTAGTGIRFLNLEYGVESTLDFIVPANTSIAHVSGLVASSLGFIPLTLVEYMGLSYFFKDYIWHEKSHAHGSNLFPYFRVSEKVLSGLTGLIYVSPYALLTLQMYNSWYAGEWWPWLLTVPYLFSNFTLQTMSYHDSYNRKVGSGMVGIHNKYTRQRFFGKGPRKDYMKDYILQTIENMRARIRKLPHSVLHMLDSTLNPEEDQELDVI